MSEVLLLEVSFRQVYTGCPLAHDVIAEMRQRDYRVYDVSSYVQRHRDFELAHADIVFVRKDSKVFLNDGWY